jgi:hypothetical protein
LRRAELVAILHLTSIDSRARVTRDHHIGQDGRPIHSGRFHRLEIDCRSSVETDEATYTSTYHDVEEFPHDWPAV